MVTFELKLCYLFDIERSMAIAQLTFCPQSTKEKKPIAKSGKVSQPNAALISIYRQISIALNRQTR